MHNKDFTCLFINKKNNKKSNENKILNEKKNNMSLDKSRMLNESQTYSPYSSANHAFHFKDYSTRKDTFKSTKMPILSYINPQNPLSNIKKTMIDFNKMKVRDENHIINVNNNPAVCYYKPNYEYILKHPEQDILFKKERSISKKYLIKKMWGSYDVSSDYRLVKLKSYLDEKYDFRNTKN